MEGVDKQLSEANQTLNTHEAVGRCAAVDGSNAAGAAEAMDEDRRDPEVKHDFGT